MFAVLNTFFLICVAQLRRIVKGPLVVAIRQGPAAAKLELPVDVLLAGFAIIIALIALKTCSKAVA